MKNLSTFLWLLKAFAINGQTTGPASGGPPPVVAKTTQLITMGTCAQVTTASAANSAFCRAAATAMKSQASGATSVTSACSKGGSCVRRRLSEAESEERKLASAPQVNVAYTISFPPNTNTATASAAVVAATSSPTALNAFKTALQQAFVANGGNSAHIVSVAAVSTPTVVVQPSGYDCKAGETCYFNFYAKGTHYHIYRASHSPAFSASDCATACTADASCESYEYLTSPNEPACSFWKNGACNILAGSPPGYVSGISYATWCDKTGTGNGAFTPVTSSSKNSCIFGFGWVLTAFLMVSMTG